MVKLPSKLKEVSISNFKSFKEQTIILGDFNIIVGRNASGKTNFIEFFKFLKKALLEERRPFMPFIEWWSFLNVVWDGNEELPIGARLKFEIDKFDVEYEVFFSGVGGRFRILSERLEIKKWYCWNERSESSGLSITKNLSKRMQRNCDKPFQHSTKDYR